MANIFVTLAARDGTVGGHLSAVTGSFILGIERIIRYRVVLSTCRSDRRTRSSEREDRVTSCTAQDSVRDGTDACQILAPGIVASAPAETTRSVAIFSQRRLVIVDRRVRVESAGPRAPKVTWTLKCR
jgi:hypothetical protein